MMKLACTRCKGKKIKCDKAEGRCHQCITASEKCVYVERRKRRRMVQPEAEVDNLSRRLESIEQRLGNTDSISPSISHSVEDSTQENPISSEVLPASRPDSPPPPENGTDSWIYRLASDVKRDFEKVNTPAGTPAGSAVDTVMSSLNEALEALGRLRIRSDESTSHNYTLKLSPEEGRACIKIFLGMIELLHVPSIFSFGAGFEVIHIMPDVVDSSYVNVDPCIRVLYYQALYYGLYKLHGPGNKLAQAAYHKVLESVPVWLAGATGTVLDVGNAILVTWTTINNFDYQLSWKFHCKASQFLRMKGVDKLDVHIAKTHEEEELRQGLRYLYWFVIQTDIMFRLFFGKPAALRWTSERDVKLPPLFIGNVNVHAPQVIIYVISIKYTVLSAQVFNLLDSKPAEERDEEVHRKIDEYCEQLEELITEWDLEPLTKSSEQPVYADYLMNMYASIIAAKRLVRSSTSSRAIDSITLRAARKVIETLLRYTASALMPKEDGIVFIHFISFYPFCAVFTLYEHILASSSPLDCESDLESLESMETLLEQACTVHADLAPFSNIIKALNKVSRAMQDSRCYGPTQSNTQSTTARAELNAADASNVTHLRQTDSQTQQPHIASPLISPTMHMDSFQTLLAPMLDPNTSPNFAFPVTNPGILDFEPFGFMRMLESDFIGRNWHETWWAMDGEVSNAFNG